MRRVFIISILTALMGSVVLANQQHLEKELVTFNSENKTVSIASLKSSDIKSTIELKHSDLINPKLIPSEGSKIISLVEHSPNGEWVLYLETGELNKNPDRYATFITKNDSIFYFEHREGPKDVLISEINGEKKVLHEFKKTAVPMARISDDNKVSWFFRREHILFTYDTVTNETESMSIQCRDAVRLGVSGKIFCINEVGPASIVSTEGNKVNEIKKLNNKFRVLSANLNQNEILLAKITTNMRFSNFLKEYHDIYSLNTRSLKLELIKEKAVLHGTSYFIR